MRVYQTTLASLLIVALSTAAYADTYTGPYVGAYADAAALNDQYSTTLEGVNASTSNGGYQLGGGLFAGYGWAFNHWYLGGEAFAQKNTNNNDDISLSEQGQSAKLDQMQTNYSFGARARGGYAFSEQTLFFLSFGVIGSRFDFSGTQLNADGNPNGTYSKKETLYAPQPGIGLETAITSHLHLRTEYTYAWYGQMKETSTANISATVKPRRSQFDLGLSYNF